MCQKWKHTCSHTYLKTITCKTIHGLVIFISHYFVVQYTFSTIIQASFRLSENAIGRSSSNAYTCAPSFAITTLDP